MFGPDLGDIPHFTNPTVVVLGGVHGAGKTTLGQRLRQRQPFHYLSPQQIQVEQPELTSMQAVLRAVRERVESHLRSKESFYFEHIMSGHYVGRLIAEAHSNSFLLHLIYLNVSDATQAIGRVANRVRSGGHDVDGAIVEARLRESRRRFWNDCRVNSDSWQLFDATKTNSPLIASGEATKKTTVLDKVSFAHFQELVCG